MAQAYRDARGSRWIRPAAWALGASLLLIPLVAMRFSDEVRWTGADFVVMAVMLAGVGGALEFLMRRGRGAAYRMGAAVAVLAVFALVWVNAAVGIIGAENDPANRMFLGVLAVGFGGAILGRFRAAGMARALLATAVAHVLVGAIALVGGLGRGDPGWPIDVIGTTGLFAALWLTAAWLFGGAAASEPRG